MAGKGIMKIVLLVAVGLSIVYFLRKRSTTPQTQSPTVANKTTASTPSYTDAAKAQAGALGIRADTLLNQLRSGETNPTTLVNKVPPFTIKTSASRPITPEEMKLIGSYATQYVHNLFIQDLYTRAINGGTITNNDINILSLNPETRVLSTQLAPVPT